jgi:UDP-2,3-diacylglucosamine pyrophosphatase LpxH
MELTMVVPDLQAPLHDAAFVEKLIDCAHRIQPDRLAFAGDLTDSTEVGRWVKGKFGEYSGQLQVAFDDTREIVGRFRAAVGDGCEMLLVDSNHDERTRKYVEENAPALSSLRSLDFTRLIGLDENGVSLVRGPHYLTPDTVLVHGHERLKSTNPSYIAARFMAEYGANVVAGHTHRPDLTIDAVGVKEHRVVRWSMNVGHGMDMAKAGYLTDGYAKWSQAFGLLDWDGEVTHPQLVLALNGKFVMGDRVW